MSLRSKRSLVLLCVTTFAFPQLGAAQNWTRVAEIPPVYVFAVAEQNGVLFASTDSAIYFSSNGGSVWAPVAAQPPSTRNYALYAHGGYLYAGTSGDGVFRSQDGGQSWQSLSAGLSGNAADIVQFAGSGESLYAATTGSGIYLLNLLNPAAWQPFNSGLFQFGGSALIASEGTLVACVGSYVFIRPPGSPEWESVGADSLQSRVPLTVHRHGDYLFLGTSGGVFRSELTGRTWRRTDILPQANRNIVAFASHGNRLLAGLNYLSDHWLWSTENHGSTWDIRAHEFATLFSLFPSNGRMWACRSDGLWSIDMGGWTPVEEVAGDAPTSPRLSQNYPNPFNPTTTINLHLPAAGHVTLKVFDALGREVSTLLSGELPAGVHSQEWNARGMAGGIYFCRLQTGSFTETRRITLLR
jgi:photosystem II stability/assembly factor-like uncharacterized protein